MGAIHSFAKFELDHVIGDPPQGISETTEETIIPGVSVIQTGPAEGHFIKLGDGADAKEYQLMIDETTVDQVIAAAAHYAAGVKSKADHKTGIGAIFGRLTNLKRETTLDGKVKAIADLHVFKTSKLHDEIVNLLKKIPDAVGFSAYFDGPVQRIGDAFFARCKELFSIDLVGEPSTNPSGVFEIKVDNPQKDEGAGTMTPEDIKNACEAAIKPHIDGIHTRLAKLEAGHAAVAKHLKLDADGKPVAGDGAPATPTDEEAMYGRFLARVIADPKIGERITTELQNTAKTLTALGLTPGSGPASSIEKTSGPGGKKPEDMDFIELVELEFSKPENAGKRDHEIIRELVMAHPAKHRAALEKRDPTTGKFIGLAKLPVRKVPFKAAA